MIYDHFSAEFREFGAIGARVQLDRATGRSRGFGFVMFADEKGLRDAIAAMDKTDVDGRRISVTRAIPQNETAPGTPAAALQRGVRGSGGGVLPPLIPPSLHSFTGNLRIRPHNVQMFRMGKASESKVCTSVDTDWACLGQSAFDSTCNAEARC